MPPLNRWARALSWAFRSDPVSGQPGLRPNDPAETILHASCVALAGRGLLITGASGSGKSGLALELMALGATLVSDDRVQLYRDGGAVMAEAPETIRGLVEARGFGLLNAEPSGPVRIAAMVDLGQTETDRLPQVRQRALLGTVVPLFHKPVYPHFPAALIQYLKCGRHAP